MGDRIQVLPPFCHVCIRVVVLPYHRNLTWFTWKTSPWKRKVNLETIIFRFHVKFRGSTVSCSLRQTQQSKTRGPMTWWWHGLAWEASQRTYHCSANASGLPDSWGLHWYRGVAKTAFFLAGPVFTSRASFSWLWTTWLKTWSKSSEAVFSRFFAEACEQLRSRERCEPCTMLWKAAAFRVGCVGGSPFTVYI